MKTLNENKKGILALKEEYQKQIAELYEVALPMKRGNKLYTILRKIDTLNEVIRDLEELLK